jgi:hypothetical protein
LTSASIAAGGVELKEATIRSWEAYVKAAQSSLEARGLGHRTFLWIDEVPNRVQIAHGGGVLVEAPRGHGPKRVPAGLVHDWVAAVFIPKATLRRVFRVVQDYDNYKAFYQPEVADSRTLSRIADCHTFSMRWRRKVLFVTSVFDTQHESFYRRLDDRRWYSVDRTTTVQEVVIHGQQVEQKLPPGQGSGFLWQVYTVSRYEERDGGVYLEMETIALSRDVPPLLGWLVSPIVDRLPRELLRRTLERTREAVLALPETQH